MPRRIVICLDETSNQVGAGHPTNVVRPFEMLEADALDRQLLYCDPGVGTMSAATAHGPVGRWLSRLTGLAFGTGPKANLAEACTYLMKHWQP
ncbi:T6SS phospholipase effector Tle1-like catalytic domain-containing protein [Streptomyces sp. NPDC096311]|uniref:T6SS phospholipase effector Tle1-like catalytic domain-containing protein n=1 Tax=Streptomyces sp. NPDC096311 TaxID=3366083 RepID=UPI0038042968